MFEKLLIANRGEIAVRIARTCRRMGVRTVAVYSEADARGRHVEACDESALIGPSPASESYLVAEKILAAAREHGCEAIHPGYGFLAEDHAFAAATAAAGLVFIGPSPAAMSKLGDKTNAKRLAVSAGVPVVPGADEVADLDQARAAAEAIGYPVLLKPSAGGGGKGMRIVDGPGSLEAAWRAGRAEAKKAFGDDRMLMERYIAQPRHLEVQVIADTHGAIIAWPERECSIQRRCQKIIEESPSPAASPELRARLADAAVRLARAAQYLNAGTVEFLLDPAGGSYFLEMNTRLQVEHPVTELVTGWDLVELQLRVAAGEALPLTQADVKPRGWAIEARICAEDPARGFLPSTGMITRYAEPRGKNVRVDSGIRPGSQVPPYYDSLLAKVIAWGEDREDARTRLIDALNGYHIEGLATNRNFVNAVLTHPAFVGGRLHTGFIPEHLLPPAAPPPPPEDHLHFMVLAAMLVFHNRQSQVKRSLQPLATRVGAAPKPAREHLYFIRGGGESYEVRLTSEPKGRTWAVTVNGKTYVVITPEFEFYRRRLKLTIDGAAHRFVVKADDNRFQISYSGLERAFELYNAREWELLPFMPAPRPAPVSNVLASPMPGIVVEVRVQPGDRVASGQVLVVIESMKMESDLASTLDGEVEAVLVTAGRTVEAGEILVKFKDQ